MNKGAYEVLRAIFDSDSLPEAEEVWEMEKFYEKLYLEIPNDDVRVEPSEEDPF